MGCGRRPRCEELGIPIDHGGSTTHRREGLEKGVEPDNCYWLRAKATSRIGVEELDLSIHPAPSLAIEVNSTSSSVDRMVIYAALGVDEVWRYDNGLRFLARSEDGTYEPIDPSLQLPWLTLAEATRQIAADRSMGRLDWMRAFRRRVRDNPAHAPQEPRHGAE